MEFCVVFCKLKKIKLTVIQGVAKLLDTIKKLVLEEEGQGMVEYGLILALVSVVVIVILTAIGGRLTGVFETVRDALPAGE